MPALRERPSGRIERLKRRVDFQAVAAGRRRFVAPGLILQTRPRGPLAAPGESPRVGFTASRKVGNAVARNRARRRLKAAAQAVLARHAAPAHDYVLIARPQTVDRPFCLLLGDLEAGLRRLGLWRGEAAPPAAVREAADTPA
ncbi:MAG: ribonuclease P protein component [Rhodospirillaceae bacterium]|nr:ribonuclease P protein component [Rhodospirillaceae bacterium]